MEEPLVCSWSSGGSKVVNMRSDYLWPMSILAAWAFLVAKIGEALGWSDGLVFAIAMAMVAVMILIVGLRHDARRDSTRQRT